MKKNKLLSYFLILAVLAIWGTIFFRIYQNWGGDNFSRNYENKHTSWENDVADKRDSIPLIANYRDPFLGHHPKSEKPAVQSPPVTYQYQTKPSASVIKKEVKKEVPVIGQKAQNWPAVQYLGMMLNKDNNTKVAILKIGERRCFVKENEQIAEMNIIEISRDLVKISYQNEIKSFTKN